MKSTREALRLILPLAVKAVSYSHSGAKINLREVLNFE